MKKYFAVSFKYSESVFCSNIAHAETAEAVAAHYSRYEWVDIREAEAHEVETARRKGMPIVEIETTEAATNEKEVKKMKFKTTQKAIKANYNTIICVPYCGLQNLLNYESPVAYTERREGWAADIYDMGGGVAIVTGYAPFGSVRPSYELLERYEKQAEIICDMYRYSTKLNDTRNRLRELQAAFIEEVTRHE